MIRQANVRQVTEEASRGTDVTAPIDATEILANRRDAYAGGRRARAVTLALLACTAVVPFTVGDFGVSLATQALILGLLAASLAHLMGTAGIPSLGHAAFFAIGAYAAGLMSIHVTTNGFLALAVAALAAAIVAVVTGILTVRSRGIYLLMLTLAIGEITRVLASDWAPVTGGDQGLVGISAVELPGLGPITSPPYVFWYVLAVTLVMTWGLLRIDHSPFGLSLRGIRDNEARMRAIGYRPATHRLASFTLAGAIGGVAGTLSVAQEAFVSPGAASFEMSAMAIIAVVIGGTRSVGAAFVGATVVIFVRDFLSHHVPGSGHLLLGVVLMFVVYMLPDGLVSLRSPLGRRRRRNSMREGIAP